MSEQMNDLNFLSIIISNLTQSTKSTPLLTILYPTNKEMQVSKIKSPFFFKKINVSLP